MLNRSLKSEFIRPHASIKVIKLGKFPGRPKDGLGSLSLPELDVERPIGILEVTLSLHHEIARVRGGLVVPGQLVSLHPSLLSPELLICRVPHRFTAGAPVRV